MAKRRTSRQVVDDDDDAYAWDEPEPPKKKRSKSAKSKKSTSGLSSSRKKASSSGRKSSSARSGKKSGSARSRSSSARSSARSSGATSARRRRSAPPPKKDNSAVLLVSLVSITLILIVGVIMINKARTPGKAENHQVELDAAQQLLDKGNETFNKWAAAKNAGQPSNQLHDEALKYLTEGTEKMSAVLQKPMYQGADGFTKPEYEGYETGLSEAARKIVDLEKSGTLH